MIKNLSIKQFLIVCLLAVLTLRAVTLEALSLMDPTESRYAFIAAEMVSSGDWVTPKLPYPEGLIPYLGKPPLHFWLTAASIWAFGGDEWVVRLPSFLGLIVICASLFFLFRKQSVEQGLVASLVAASIALLFFFGGSSVVDVTLAALITVGIVSYVICAEYKENMDLWQTLFFASLGFGFLTKGPVAIVLTLFPLFIWHCLDRSRKLPPLSWVKGILLAVLIPLPWFIISELRNPGFTSYFFIHENFLRYVSKDYGDKYGSGHRHMYGAIWWMFSAGLLPWTPLVLILLKKQRDLSLPRDFLVDLGLAWSCGVCLFFTFIKQLHAGYTLPAFPGAAVLLTALLMKEEMRAIFKVYLKYLIVLLAIVATLMVGANFYLNYGGENFTRCILVGVFTFVTYYLFNRERRADLSLTTRELAIGIVALTSTYATTNLALASFIADRSSAEGILAYLTANESGANNQFATSEVSTITRNTFSHYYYGKEWETELSHPVHMNYIDPMDFNGKDVPKNLIVSDRELKLIPVEIQKKYIQKHVIGNWIWLAKKSAGLIHRS